MLAGVARSRPCSVPARGAAFLGSTQRKETIE